MSASKEVSRDARGHSNCHFCIWLEASPGIMSAISLEYDAVHLRAVYCIILHINAKCRDERVNVTCQRPPYRAGMTMLLACNCCCTSQEEINSFWEAHEHRFNGDKVKIEWRLKVFWPLTNFMASWFAGRVGKEGQASIYTAAGLRPQKTIAKSKLSEVGPPHELHSIPCFSKSCTTFACHHHLSWGLQHICDLLSACRVTKIPPLPRHIKVSVLYV